MATLGGRATDGPTGPITSNSNSNGRNVSQREDLANFISQITRDETPFMSSIGKTKATAIFHEWQTDELAAPADSTILEGANYLQPGSTSAADAGPNSGAFANIGPHRTRLGNYTQINGKTLAVSGTRRAVDQAGVADEYAYQLKKRGTELRRDVERSLVHSHQIRNATESNTATRTFGGYQAFVNDFRTCEGLSVSDSAYTAATSAAGQTYLNDATGGKGTATTEANNTGKGNFVPNLVDAANRRALSLSDIDSVMQKIYEEGGKASKIMLSPKLRRDFSDLMVTDSGVRRNIDMDGKLRQSVDIYMSDFGDLMVVPNYIMGLSTSTTANDNLANSTALVYDPQWFALATLRPLQEVDVGQLGDSTIGMLVEEATLEVKNPLGSGAIYNLA